MLKTEWSVPGGPYGKTYYLSLGKDGVCYGSFHPSQPTMTDNATVVPYDEFREGKEWEYLVETMGKDVIDEVKKSLGYDKLQGD